MSLVYVADDGLDRLLAYFSVPVYAINKNETWMDNGACVPIYPKTKNCAFYRSTGTSNTFNFPDSWFPFLKIRNDGWVHKATGLQESKKLAQELTRLGINTQEIQPFLDKFSHWFQVQISASLTDDFLLKFSCHDKQTTKTLSDLRKIALTYSFDKCRGLYKDSTIRQKAEIADVAIVTDDFETINEWLQENDACVDLN